MEMVPTARWIDLLEDEDLSFIKRFILFSGSLKDLADSYKVSYPTVRLRLDRLIQKIKILDDRKIEDGFERLLRAQFADGKLDSVTFKQLLAAYRDKQKEQNHEKENPSHNVGRQRCQSGGAADARRVRF